MACLLDLTGNDSQTDPQTFYGSISDKLIRSRCFNYGFSKSCFGVLSVRLSASSKEHSSQFGLVAFVGGDSAPHLSMVTVKTRSSISRCTPQAYVHQLGSSGF